MVGAAHESHEFYGDAFVKHSNQRRCFLEEVAEFSGNGKSIMILCIQAGLKTGKTLFPVLLNVVAVSPNARRTTPRFDGFPCADFYEKGR